MQYRFDQLQFSSTLPQFINIGRPTGTLSISGTIAAGSGQNFTTTVNLLSTTSFVDVKITSNNNGLETYVLSAASLDPIWEYAGHETVQTGAEFKNGQVIIAVTVGNYGGTSPITIISQTFKIEVIEYDIPF